MQVDEHAPAQQPVHLFLAGGVRLIRRLTAVVSYAA